MADETELVERWRPIETAPKDGVCVLLMTYKPVTGYWCDGWRDERIHGIRCEPTHWMPLPAPPRAALSGEAS